MNSEREIVKKLLESKDTEQHRYRVHYMILDSGDRPSYYDEIVIASTPAEAEKMVKSKIPARKLRGLRDLKAYLYEDAQILPDKDDKDTIVRGEHHPISTADRPNIEMSESLEDEEDHTLDEKTYTVGDTQYWKRGGKCYSWTSSGGRQECTEEEYMKAISGGNDTPSASNNSSDSSSGSDTPKDAEPDTTTPKKESPYSKYGFSKKPTEKKMVGTVGKYLSGDPARDIAFVLFDPESKSANLVNHDKKYVSGDPSKGSSYEGSVDRLIKDKDTQEYFEEYLDSAIKKTVETGDTESSGILNMIKDKYEERTGRSVSKDKNSDSNVKSKKSSKTSTSDITPAEVDKYMGEWTETSGDEKLDTAYGDVRKANATWRKVKEIKDTYAKKLERKLRKERGIPTKRHWTYAEIKKFEDDLEDVRMQVQKDPEYKRLDNEDEKARINFEDTSYAFKDTFKDAKARGVKYPYDYYVASTEMDDYD